MSIKDTLNFPDAWISCVGYTTLYSHLHSFYMQTFVVHASHSDPPKTGLIYYFSHNGI